jgi:hypothetical protein
VIARPKPNATRQVRLRCLDEQVAMVGHQAVGAANPTEAVDRVGERVEEELAIGIDEEDVLPRVAAARYAEPRRSRSRQVDSESRPTPQLLPREAALDCAGGALWRQSSKPDLSSQDLTPSP